MRKWGGAEIGRERAMPHMKSYCRCSNDGSGEVAWACISSANLSPAAWGANCNTRGGYKFKIKNYEVCLAGWISALQEDSLGGSPGDAYSIFRTHLALNIAHQCPILAPPRRLPAVLPGGWSAAAALPGARLPEKPLARLQLHHAAPASALRRRRRRWRRWWCRWRSCRSRSAGANVDVVR